MDIDTSVKLAVYRYFAETGRRPTVEKLAVQIGLEPDAVQAAFQRLAARRLLVLEADGQSIRMASPFSGVETQHVVAASGRTYYANCAWDALGIIAALQAPGTVHSRCEQSGEPFNLAIGRDGPEPSGWLFHCLVPAAHWWDDIVYT